MNGLRVFSAVLLGYSIVVALGVEAGNEALGGLLPIPYEELHMEGSGYGKIRGAGGDFQELLFLLGTWVYPACAVALWGFGQLVLESKSRLARAVYLLAMALYLLAMALATAILMRFFYLGVFTTAWAQAL